MHGQEALRLLRRQHFECDRVAGDAHRTRLLAQVLRRGEADPRRVLEVAVEVGPFRHPARAYEDDTPRPDLHPLLAGWRQPNHKSDISGLSGECCGRWTPDGKYFVFDSGGQLWALREKESLLRKVSREPMQLTSGAINYGFPIPSKDGRKLFAVAGLVRGELVRYDGKSKAIEPFLSGISAQDVAFSKDGQWVAYVSFPEGTLWRSKADGSDRLQVSFPPLCAMLPHWSPDGKQIVFYD